jgi:DNA-directed RNA polymerase specialized sigma24 family protein
MKDRGQLNESPGQAGERFVTTQWNLVLSACKTPSPTSQAALELLCRTYWSPLYAYLRRHGHSVDEAQDLTQGFFAFVLEHHTLDYADPQRGRFRHFLLAALKRYLLDEHRLSSALKRGPKFRWLPWNDELPTPPPDDPPAHLRSAEECYENRWAITLLGKVLEDLRTECNHRADPKLFDHLKDHICMDDDAVPYAGLAGQLGIPAVTLRVTVHRLRQRYRELLRSEIARTVGSPAEIDDEIRHLITVVAW